jgi:molybdate transport system substrate-binding protein
MTRNPCRERHLDRAAGPWRRAALALTALVVLGAGCRRDVPHVLVFAAASTSGVMQEIGRAFETTSGTRVELSFAGSNELARQITAGAPADVFLAASPREMDALERAGKVAKDERVDLLSNELVVVVPASSSTRVDSPADLEALPRLALADPVAVPAGMYAKSWLVAQGLWDRLAPKVVPALDVRAALAAVASGSLPAGIVYRTDAASSPAVRIVLAVPRTAGPAIVYPVAPIKNARSPLARPFVAFLQGPQAREAFARAGFIVIAGP